MRLSPSFTHEQASQYLELTYSATSEVHILVSVLSQPREMTHLLMSPTNVVSAIIELFCGEFSRTVMCQQSEEQRTEHSALRNPCVQYNGALHYRAVMKPQNEYELFEFGLYKQGNK